MLEMSEDVFYTAVIFYRVLDIVWWPFVLLQWQEVPLFGRDRISWRIYQSFFVDCDYFQGRVYFFLSWNSCL